MIQTVAIFGVGLIGGSFGMALRRAGFTGRILGVSSAATVEKARALGVIDAGATLEQACGEADLLYLAQPISRILEQIPEIGRHLAREALVTDAGSTKRRICQIASEHLPAGVFLGGHPMAGKERRGVEEADAGLFRDRTYILTPTGPWNDRQTEFAGWVERIGAVRLELSPDVHDRAVAFTSHLPQLTSTALAQTLSRYLGPEYLPAGGPGLRDMTRLAKSSFEIWADILATNPDCIEEALRLYLEVLQDLLGSLRSGGPGTAAAFAEAESLARRVSANL